MNDPALEAIAVFAGLAAGMAAAAVMLRGRVDRVWFALTLLACGVYEAGYGIARAFPLAFLEGAAWNWQGKAFAALAVLLLVAILPGVGARRVGLALRQTPGWRAAWLAVAGLCVMFVYAALQFPPAAFEGDWETLAFQLTMPSIDEELFFRGLLPVMIDRTFGVSRRVLGASFGWGGVLSALAFGLLHGVGFEDGAFAFAAAPAAYTVLAGLILYWLKARTGSLLAPVFIHSFGNAIFLLI